jgi:hypothetical protein
LARRCFHIGIPRTTGQLGCARRGHLQRLQKLDDRILIVRTRGFKRPPRIERLAGVRPAPASRIVLNWVVVEEQRFVGDAP